MKRYYSMTVIKCGNFYRIAYILNSDPENAVRLKPFAFRTLDSALRYVYYLREV